MRREDIERFGKIVAKLQGKEEKGKYEYMSLCPAHGDARLSLWVKLEENGKITLYCHAGCSQSDVCEALGFKISFLYPIPQIVDLFDYVTASGELLYQEIKYDKTALRRFKVRRPADKKNSKDPWIWDIKNTPLILYNLFEIINAKPDELAFMCEGAKDARTLLRLQILSTAVLFNNWVEADTSPLDNRPVIILVDNDEGGETKALIAAHDRHKKSSCIKLLRLPGLDKGGDVTDWLAMKGENTKEKLLALAMDSDLPEWFPKESLRDCIAKGRETGLAFEHNDPRPAFLEWLETFHPSEEGPLYFYDDEWLKGNPKSLIFKPISKNRILEDLTQFFLLCYNRNSRNSEDLFKPTPKLMETILKSGEVNRDLDEIENPVVPIFVPFFMSKKEKDYKTEDIIILKDYNFYVPERLIFERNMDACVALASLPFNYDEKAKCPEIEKAFDKQWKDDQQSTDLLLQFIYYAMKHTHIYKAILCMIGDSDTGKTQILELIRHFIGQDSCEALSLGKIGRPFELYRARNAQLLISDDLHITSFDLQDGALVENMKSIPSGAPIRLEKKGGIIYSKKLPCQIILAGNEPPKIQQFSNALANRFYFLNFAHVFKRGKDMDPNIIDVWIKELAGLLNKVLDAGEDLIKNHGFIEPESSADIRARFEGGSTPIRKFIRDWFNLNAIDDKVKWFTRISDMNSYYKMYCEEEGINQLSMGSFNDALESIVEITKVHKHINIPDEKGSPKRTNVRGWEGVKRKGTSGNPQDEIGKAREF